MNSRLNLLIIISISAFIALILGLGLWHMNFWPTDTELYYLPAVQKLFQLQHLSNIHDTFDQTRVRWLHGKELYILASAVIGKLIGDVETLRPFIVLGLGCIFFSSILIYLIARRFWEERVAVICYGLFITSFWPYVYVLFTKHQTLGLLCFLLSIVLLWFVKLRHIGWVFYLLSGLMMGCCLFASPVSTAYVPLYATAYFVILFQNTSKARLLNLIFSSVLVTSGVILILCYVNYPNIIHNLKGFIEYIGLSNQYNHFYYDQLVLQQWIPKNIAETRGGWLWVFRYFFLIMPVLFPVYLISAFYLIWKGKGSRFKEIGLIVLSLSPVILAEIKGIAQYGGNYFPAMAGVLILVGHTCQRLYQSNFKHIRALLIIVFTLHIGINFLVFITDIYPCRMATAVISQKIKNLKIDHIYTYKNHPHANTIVGQLNKEVREHMRFVPIDHIMQPQEGYILLPPISKDSIYLAAHSDFTNFDDDIFLNQLVKNGKLKDYAVTFFDTLVSSRIWAQEEEILTYRRLILHQWINPDLGKVWLLDAQKIQQARLNNLPSPEYIDSVQNNVRNIGTKDLVYMYKGIMDMVPQESNLKNFAARIYKVGNPSDNLVAYVFKLDKEQPVWIPHSEHYKSESVQASTITTDPQGGLVVFKFPQALKQSKGPYYLVIYRTGNADNKNYYRIYTDFQKRISF